MTSGTTTLDAATVLTVARQARREANAAEARVLAAAVEWAALHAVVDLDDASTVLVEGGRDTGIPIAGQGAPLVSEFAVCEFATALGLTAASGRTLVGLALELAHRLPKTWARVQDGSLAPWRARRIAEATLHLNAQAAGFVDTQVAPFAHKTGPAQAQRTIDTAIATFMPEYAAEQRDRAVDQRYFSIDHDQVSFAGTSRVHGELDLADALDLEDAVAAGAQQLADLGSTDTLDIRRSVAVGALARGELALDFEGPATDNTTEREPEPEREPGRTETGRTRRRTGARRRDVVLYVHLSEDALRTHDPDAVVELENAGGQLLTAAHVAQWCGRPDTDRIIVKPVIDLTTHHPIDAYQVPDRVAEEVELRDRECVFPWCHRPARRCDKDHRIPHHKGGPTCPCNLAPLCRLHHRVKTHGGWTYTTLEPGTYLWRSPHGYTWVRDTTGTYLWRSPHGYTWVRDTTGTTDLTPPPVDPPPRRTN